METLTLDFGARSMLDRSVSAFNYGDVDLARRSLVAAHGHHTRESVSLVEQHRVSWCLIWYSFSERRYDKAYKHAQKVYKLEQEHSSPSASRRACLQWILFMCARASNDSEVANLHFQLCIDSMQAANVNHVITYSALQAYLQTDENGDDDDYYDLGIAV